MHDYPDGIHKKSILKAAYKILKLECLEILQNDDTNIRTDSILSFPFIIQKMLHAAWLPEQSQLDAYPTLDILKLVCLDSLWFSNTCMWQKFFRFYSF